MVEYRLPVSFYLLLSGAQVLHALVKFGKKGFYTRNDKALGWKGGKGNGEVL